MTRRLFVKRWEVCISPRTADRCLVLLLLAASADAQAYPQYSIADLGTLGGSYAIAYAINAAGQVTGQSATASSGAHAFLYNGSMLDLGTLAGPDSGLSSTGFALNAVGEVTGSSATASAASHAFLYSSSQMSDLGTLGGPNSSGQGINTSGQVAGFAYVNVSTVHAFLYNGAMQDLGTLGGTNSYAEGINASGQVVGYSNTSTGSNHAFLYTSGKMQDLGTLGTGTNSYAYAVNANGDVTGQTDTSQSSHAFLYSGGALHDLGSLGGTSVGYAINSSGQVTGQSTLGGGSLHGFLYTSGAMFDLNELISGTALAPYVTLSEGLGINDSGLIVAEGVDSRTQLTHAYLLTPSGGTVTPPPTANVDYAGNGPLPLWALTVLGLGLLTLASRRTDWRSKPK
jgi:probable HAF family extracellular repeat protein